MNEWYIILLIISSGFTYKATHLITLITQLPNHLPGANSIKYAFINSFRSPSITAVTFDVS